MIKIELSRASGLPITNSDYLREIQHRSDSFSLAEAEFGPYRLLIDGSDDAKSAAFRARMIELDAEAPEAKRFEVLEVPRISAKLIKDLNKKYGFVALREEATGAGFVCVILEDSAGTEALSVNSRGAL